MAVMMGLRMDVDPERFMDVVAQNAERFKSISERGRSGGAIQHMFMAGEYPGGVADERASAESFLAFFQEAGGEIASLTEQARVTNEPQPTSWHSTRRTASTDRVYSALGRRPWDSVPQERGHVDVVVGDLEVRALTI